MQHIGEPMSEGSEQVNTETRAREHPELQNPEQEPVEEPKRTHRSTRKHGDKKHKKTRRENSKVADQVGSANTEPETKSEEQTPTVPNNSAEISSGNKHSNAEV